jgi:outer membrane protein assembly factor BamB
MKTKKNKSNTEKPIRLLPAIIIVVMQWIGWMVAPIFIYGAMATATMTFSALLGGLAIIIWWLFFSRTPRLERLIVLAVLALALFILPQFSHESIRTGMVGLMFFVYALPTLSLVLILWIMVSKNFPQRKKLLTMSLAIFISCGIWLSVRSGGLSSNAKADFSWRWKEVSNESFLSQKVDPHTSTLSTNTIAEWPGFRGPNRDGIVHGSKIETDWSTSPPKELWRRPVGAGCSSFASQGDFIFTQEQRDEYELVSCYNLFTGEPVWLHKDSTRFYDQHAGAGPRSTPTLNQGRIYTLGATGIINVLDGGNGSLFWSKNAANDTDSKDSGWGFTSSPLVVNETVVVASAGNLIAYNTNSGEEIWTYSDSTDSYSSAHLLKINGENQIAFLSGNGATGLDIENGKPLWYHSWPAETRILQPVILANQDFIINSGQKKGLRRIKLTNQIDGWHTEELWTSNRMRPDFNDFVFHKGHIFGFDGPNIACLEVENGQRKWRGSRYGGQMILLADQELLLILSEKGEIVLVKADPNEYIELGKIEAINGKTWNHPVLVKGILLVRNAKEMVAYRLN